MTKSTSAGLVFGKSLLLAAAVSLPVVAPRAASGQPVWSATPGTGVLLETNAIPECTDCDWEITPLPEPISAFWRSSGADCNGEEPYCIFCPQYGQLSSAEAGPDQHGRSGGESEAPRARVPGRRTCVASGDSVLNVTAQEALAWMYENSCDWFLCEESARMVALIGEVRGLAERGDVRRLRELIDSTAGRVYFNAERGALQGRGCAGKVVLHVPLSSHVAQQLANYNSMRRSMDQVAGQPAMHTNRLIIAISLVVRVVGLLPI
jgi:hypothetical protein